MRISADPSHRDYSDASIYAKVYLDGVLIGHCVTADEEAGAAECYAIVDGRILVNGGGYPEFEALLGNVRIDVSDCTLPAEFIGFDAWMRARTDRAHAEYMAGHAAGGVAYGAP